MLFDWGDLKHFLAVAESGSLSQAAQTLGVSQPTVGRRLDALELQLGAKLFVRSGSGMAVTELGRAVLDHARRVREEAAAIARAVDQRDNSLSGTVRLASLDGTGPFLADGLERFYRKHPNILVEVLMDERSADLTQREADIAIRLFRPKQNSLVTRRLMTADYGFYAARAFLNRVGRPKTLEDLENYPFIEWLEHGPLTFKQDSFREGITVTGRPVFRTNNVSMSVRAAVAGAGVARLPEIIGESEPDLERLFPDRVVAELDIWLVAHADLRATARIRALWDHIVAEADTYRTRNPGIH